MSEIIFGKTHKQVGCVSLSDMDGLVSDAIKELEKLIKEHGYNVCFLGDYDGLYQLYRPFNKEELTAIRAEQNEALRAAKEQRREEWLKLKEEFGGE